MKNLLQTKKHLEMKKLHKYPKATFESVWAFMHENDRVLSEKFAKTEQLIQENAVHMKEVQHENDRMLTEKFAETDRLQKENERILNEKFAETDWRMKELQKTVGGWSNSHGSFAEAYFYNSFEAGEQNFFGERFDKIKKNAIGLKIGFEDEYDIMLINGKSIGLIEVKFRAKKEHFSKLLKKAITFRENFPDYKNHKIYLGFAALCYYEEFEQQCMDNGIAIIKQVGETVVICDGHLRGY
jgi:hypothetical protein